MFQSSLPTAFSKYSFERYGTTGSSDYMLWGFQDNKWYVLGHISSPVIGPWLVEGTDAQFPTRNDAKAFVIANAEYTSMAPSCMIVQTNWDAKPVRGAAAVAAPVPQLSGDPIGRLERAQAAYEAAKAALAEALQDATTSLIEEAADAAAIAEVMPA